MDSSAVGRAAFVVFGNLVLALTLWVVNRSPMVNWIGWTLAVPAVVLSLMAHLGNYPYSLVIGHLLEAALYFYAAVGLIFYMLADNEVTFDELLAAAATFTLLAWAFAFVFSVCQAISPGSFTGAVNPQEARGWLELLFLSFSVLSSVGLSDVIPIQPMARSLVMLEMFCGVMYMAIVVSRLIAMAATMRGHPKQ
ncbi:hypothetical protein BGE01nite_31780 [Brevifollis gellanilyticus]|uniref:Potassium channel domain-containing protein n=2 Tax=Brevifollis gellanilyticus TaxID=748831 RepID=A0A512MAX0_9BACT|nr:hypothetical protein BGE01nite_31780 [Brevifollis gellanilyticus]